MRRQFRSKRKQGGWWQYAAAAAAAAANYLGQKNTNEENVQLGRDQMDFQERMSSTAYQRAVQDMQKAGLNPMLAYSQGGASSPVGSMPQVQNAVGAAVSSASQTMGMIQGLQQIEQSKAQTERFQAETEKIKSETMPYETNLRSREQNIQVMLQRENLTAAQYWESIERRGLIKNQADRTKAEEAWRLLETARNRETFDADVARRKAESILKNLDLARGEMENKFFSDNSAGEYSKYLQQMMDMLKIFSSARR